MSDTQPTQAMPATDDAGDHGKQSGVGERPKQTAGGESGGGAYPNPHTGKTPEGGGLMGHGGQTHIDYSGTGTDDDAVGNANAVTGKE